MRVGFALRSAEIKPIVRQCVFDCWFVFFFFDDHLIQTTLKRSHKQLFNNSYSLAWCRSLIDTREKRSTTTLSWFDKCTGYCIINMYVHFFKSHDNECLQQHMNLPVCLAFFSTIGRTQTASCVLPAWSRPFLTHNMDRFFLLHILYSVWLLTTDIIVLCMFHHTYNQIKCCIVRGYLHGWCLCQGICVCDGSITYMESQICYGWI